MEALGWYWTIILLVVPLVVFIILLWSNQLIWFAVALGQLISNNNLRWWTLFILTLISFFDCFFAGFGPPVFTTQVVSPAVQKVQELNNSERSTEIKKSLVDFIVGENIRPTESVKMADVIEEPQKPPKHYHGWWHWKVFILLLLATIIYMPVAYREEAIEAWQAALQSFRQKTVSGGADSGTKEKEEKDKAAKEKSGISLPGWSFMKEIKAEVFAEFIMFWFSKIFGIRR